MKRRIAFIVCLLACAAVYAGETSKLLKTRLSSGSAAKAGVWLSNFSKAKNYAVDNGLPLIAVWSNGDSCGHCVTFESSCNSSYFRKWMASSGMVFYFTHSGESQGAVGGSIFNWCRKNKNTSYPFVRIYWPDGKVDIATVGDTVDGKKDGTTGGKKAVAYFKSKLKNFKPHEVYCGRWFLFIATALIQALHEDAGAKIYVCVPDGQRSATSHGITMNKPITVEQVELEHVELAYTTSGLPADCIKVGMEFLRRAGVHIDMVYSGNFPDCDRFLAIPRKVDFMAVVNRMRHVSFLNQS